MADAPLDLASIRERLRTARGPQYWRSLEELADTPAFREALEREFPQGASEWLDTVSRRRFLQLMGASMALAGLSACTRQPKEAIVPYVKQPEELVPGRPLFFATASLLGGVATGVLVESHEGRPTKVEGNPEHPASLGGADLFGQASILGLYDPDRSQVVLERGRIRTWSAFLQALDSVPAVRKDGTGLRFLSEQSTSPTLAAQRQELARKFPRAKWHVYEPAARDNAHAGARLAFGENADVRYEIAKADVLLSLDADFVCDGPGHLRYAREFARRRRVESEADGMNRLYVVESAPTSTGAVADHRLAVRAGDVEGFARAVAAEIGVAIETGATLEGERRRWIEALARDLRKHRGASLVIAGDRQPPVVHAIAHAMNERLGNVGRTVVHSDPIDPDPVDPTESLLDLVDDIDNGAVDVLFLLGGNPVYDAPADLELSRRLEKVALRVRLGLYDDETSEHCHWHVPQAHPLETWSDARAFDGTVTILQPLIAPLYDGKSVHELVAAVLGQRDRTGHDIVREHWKGERGDAGFEERWRRWLHDGVVDGTALAGKRLRVRGEISAPRRPREPRSPLELVFRTDPTVYDGRFTNNGWLQELPKPLTKLVWENVAQMSPATAERLGLSNGDVVELGLEGRTARAPVWIQPGHADDSVAVTLGYGRRRAGRVGEGAGFDAYALRSSDAPWIAAGLQVRKTGERRTLATTQEHHSMEGRNLVRTAALEHFREHPDFAQHAEHAPKKDQTLFTPHEYPGHAWGMAIDLNSCTGCGVCSLACQAENNIPVVGKEEVIRGREMHWIRVDRYFEGDLDDPKILHQPIPCMHCENAPCELVCPVAATVHSDEGLNDMVYNRCVGTRYCSNNCPYKVRRFNFFLYSDWETESLKPMRNPDVTVRSRGVMEKCTYCVQRINGARIAARREGREIRDGEIVTACQQACPSEAIVFGDVNDPESQVSKLKASPRNYALLADLNTRPRTTYLAGVRNPNLELEESVGTEHEEHGEG